MNTRSQVFNSVQTKQICIIKYSLMTDSSKLSIYLPLEHSFTFVLNSLDSIYRIFHTPLQQERRQKNLFFISVLFWKWSLAWVTRVVRISNPPLRMQVQNSREQIICGRKEKEEKRNTCLNTKQIVPSKQATNPFQRERNELDL